MKDFLNKKYEEIKENTESLEIEILKTEKILESLKNQHAQGIGTLNGLSIVFNQLEAEESSK